MARDLAEIYPRRLTAVCGGAALLIGAGVALEVSPDWLRINPVEAWGFLLLGGALLISLTESTPGRWAGRTLAAAALALYRQHRGDRAVSAVIYTHSHVDHFGGVLGVTTQADVDAGTVAVLAPEGFIDHAVPSLPVAGSVSVLAMSVSSSVIDRAVSSSAW